MKGGKRIGSGRPKNSKDRPKITDYMTPKEIKDKIKLFLRQCNDKPDSMRFLMEQIFGKATQSLDLTTGGDKINTMSYEQARETILERERRRGAKGNGTE